jgi:quercetin dioxygenase-like cupin family protein
VDAWSRDDLDAAHAAAGGLYHEFLRVPALSCGLYVLAAGAIDPQSPHSEDEIYHVLAGRARITVGGDARDVAAGDTVLVAAGVEHRFHDVADELRVLVVFGPAERA